MHECKFVRELFVRDLFENECHSSVNFDADSKSVLGIKKFLMLLHQVMLRHFNQYD